MGILVQRARTGTLGDRSCQPGKVTWPPFVWGGGGNLCRRQDIIWQNNPFSTYVNPNSMFLQMGRLSEYQFQILAHSPIRLYALVRLS